MVLFHEPSFRTELQQILSTGYVRKDRSAFVYLAVLVIGVGARYAAGSPDAESSYQGHDLDSLGRKLIRCIELKLLEIFDESGIEAVQIAIVMSSYHLYHGLPKRSFATLGSALKVALSIGLHKESSWRMSDHVVKEVWRRLWWALYTAEVFGAISYGTPCLMQDNEWDVAMPANIEDVALTCPGFDSQETYEGVTVGPVTIFSYQRFKFRLYRIASAITRNIYLRSGVTLKDIVREIKCINQRLTRWEKCIPPELRPESLKSLPTNERCRETTKVFQLQALVLQLSYDNIQLVLHRPLLTMNQVPRWPLIVGIPSRNTADEGLNECADEVNDMIKSSKCQCWISSLRTSTIGDYPDHLVASRSTHGAAYTGIQSFTAGVVLGIFALSDPLSDQAHQAKRALSKIIKLPKLHQYRTTVSDQCGQILEELLRLILAEEMKALLVDTGGPFNSGRTSANNNIAGSANVSGTDTTYDRNQCSGALSDLNQNRSQSLSQGSELDMDTDFFPLQSLLPSDIHDGNFSDALLSLQDVFRDGKGNATPAYVSRSQLSTRTTPTVTNMQLPLSQVPGNAPPRTTKPFDITTQAWIWDDLLWLPDAS
ncbi:uncharacterized protein A1O9_10583 [Exophiala aquamarina CBS 119918]|uniref:Xylanolytic transcriptional activator regulatory domain-containing protein n=1 Tax=Exophiala aquamarina CBS 119918 TaxID=1182545 RepID=A0A072P2W6_9EURO|nr:uncharacterized protein A1O9_10583 [Exophiala aquamarina CBS 119918]KEF53608.1 hypothetical protein A1O9_10583 [Exophiala aquamarina CBS 119918]